MSYTITSLKEQIRNHSRVAVFLDGGFGFGITKSVALDLHIGEELSETDIQRIKQKDEMEYAYQRAYHFISYRPRSVQEVEKKLEKLSFSGATIAETISRAKENHLLDDAQFSQTWVENRSAFKPRSKWLLSHELRQKGIAEQLIVSATETVDDREMAILLSKKFQKKLADSDWKSFQSRLGGYLQRKGFSYEIIKPIIQEAWDEQHGK